MDTRDAVQRRRIMQAVRNKNTAPEIRVRSLLHRMGYRFRLHGKDLPGTPDIILPKYRSVIFVHGCFWHAHNCPKGRPPKTRQDYWLNKLAMNVERDRLKEEQLYGKGWQVMVVWQCELNDQEALKSRLRGFVDKSHFSIDKSGIAR
ncbi:DNA mismatch endonuclease Vsr [Hoeflea sp. G2-23]|uniref:Very short patch repair endonuclease n=1 Tax=Hoeflea algicola TaxID=2983763 RepID=A0ABT3ZC07_9HYPH|nr:DNA mismatch endonuclease Vsr [Hoeflea algicola]MCY0149340.1 DNA mismatch endonuclease Vsr [Hoeflea algicola]